MSLSVVLAGALAVAFGLSGAALAQSASAEQFPRFGSFKSAETFMREGPSASSRIKWVYHHKGLPVEVLAQYDVWRRVRDSDGEIGWVHAAMLSKERTALVTGTGYASMRAEEKYQSDVVAEVQPGAIGELRSCTHLACKVTFGDTTGWVDRSRLYGIYVAETF